MIELKYFIFNCEIGWLGVLASAKGLLRTTLPQPSAQQAQQLLGDKINQTTWSASFFRDLMERFRLYFTGYRVTFPDKLDLSGATPFQRKVWRITQLIGHGETRSYRWVAEQMKSGQTARAVGQALKRNQLPIIIPCHRVIASNGQLVGYSGGIEMKQRLLNLEAFSQPRSQL